MAEGNRTLKNEQTVREYFEKPGWKVTKLDTGKKEAADYRVCREDGCCLCEVKTIESDRESRPPGPSEDYFASRTKEQRDAIQDHLNAHPDAQVVLPPGQWEDLYGPEDDFLRRYSNIHRGTLKPFEDFGRSLKQYLLEKPNVTGKPFMVRLDSDDLYVPGRKDWTLDNSD